MALLHLLARNGQPAPVADGIALDAALERALDAAGDGPLVVMVHGYRYAPGVPGADPHAALFGARRSGTGPRQRAWPHHLRLTALGAGLAIGFGWPARGTLWRALRAAEGAGHALGALIAALDAAAPGRPVHLIAHSLGARVALAGIATAPAGRAGRVILLSPAEFRSRARAALAAPAGRGAEVLAVTARANAPFDAAFAALVPPPAPGDAVLGRGLPGVARWLDLDLDDGPTLAALATLGHRIAPPRALVCHWSGYLRPGAFGLYRHLLRDAPGDGFARIAHALRRAEAGSDAPLGAGLPPVALAPA